MATLHADPDCPDCNSLIELIHDKHLSVRVDRRCELADCHTLTDGDDTAEGHQAAREHILHLAEMRDHTHRRTGDYCTDFGEGID